MWKTVSSKGANWMQIIVKNIFSKYLILALLGLSCSMWGSSSLTRDEPSPPTLGTWNVATGHQGSPMKSHFKRRYTSGILES